jgi:hypothetical protein
MVMSACEELELLPGAPVVPPLRDRGPEKVVGKVGVEVLDAKIEACNTLLPA